jgi:hypothetical protein
VVRAANKRFCDHSPRFPDLLFGINEAEAKWAFESIIMPLNDAVRTAAALWGWVYVGGIASEFGGAQSEHLVAHGYCANAVRWARTFNDSLQCQRNEKGMLHPNPEGHKWYARRLVQELQNVGIVIP